MHIFEILISSSHFHIPLFLPSSPPPLLSSSPPPLVPSLTTNSPPPLIPPPLQHTTNIFSPISRIPRGVWTEFPSSPVHARLSLFLNMHLISPLPLINIRKNQNNQVDLYTRSAYHHFCHWYTCNNNCFTVLNCVVGFCCVASPTKLLTLFWGGENNAVWFGPTSCLLVQIRL